MPELLLQRKIKSALKQSPSDYKLIFNTYLSLLISYFSCLIITLVLHKLIAYATLRANYINALGQCIERESRSTVT